LSRHGGADRDRGGGGGGGQQEMVERLVSGFGDVVEGKASWKDLLRGVLAPDLLGGGGGGGGRKR